VIACNGGQAFRTKEWTRFDCFSLSVVFQLVLLFPCYHAFSIVPKPLLQENPHLRTAFESSKRCRAASLFLSEARNIFPSVTPKEHKWTGWYPRLGDLYQPDEDLKNLEDLSVALAADLVRMRLSKRQVGDPNIGTCKYSDKTNGISDDDSSTRQTIAMDGIVRGRFMDLTCSAEGESALEDLFFHEPEVVTAVSQGNLHVIRGAVMILQSLCAMGTQVGISGTPDKLRRMVAHLDDRNDLSLVERDLLDTWDRDSVRRLKFRLDRSPAFALLSELRWKRNSQGSFDLLVLLGAWTKHEDLALLRSGFPLRFTEQEEDVARMAVNATADPDGLLGIRRDFRGMKVYTIDGASTSEIDDGLSIERLQKANGSEGYRIWIHIADADHWAPRNSSLWEIGRQRVTSLYLPSGAIPMFPSSVSADLMSLNANSEAYALSLGVELNDDGSVDPSSVIVTPSIIRVTYRLTYDDADEMLSEGIAYSEEWELGALLSVAEKRRRYRISHGSSEGMVPNPIPFAAVQTFPDESAPDGIGVSLNVEVSHNAGKNHTSGAEGASESSLVEASVSSAYLLVTETMILVRL
jgi:hypothetical protein